MSVAIIRREKSNSIKKAIELCDGFRKLQSDHKVLIKPNLVIGADKKMMPPFGKVTTASAIEHLIQALFDHNCRRITIGEGAIVVPEFGSNTALAMKFSGIDSIGKKYGVKLEDFETSAFKSIEINGNAYEIATSALEADFVINVPVLKTHGQTIVSLGMKNLKGCLKFSSKKRAHKRGHLFDLIAELNTHIKSDLIIIDGTYAMDRGPVMGTAHPMNLIIAGTDILETEIVGAAVLGKDPKKIPHIQSYCKLTNDSVDLESIEIKGESIDKVILDLPWKGDFNKCFKNFELSGIQVSSGTADTSICSACYGNMEFANYMFCKDNPGLNIDRFEICIGKESKATPDAKEVILFGNCAIKNNQKDERATKVIGCPPDVGQYYPLLVKKALPVQRSIPLLLARMVKSSASKMGLYRENFGLWDEYQSPDFDQSHY